MTGTHQSPINIISLINTQEDASSYISFDYNLQRDFAEKLEKFTYDGRGLSLKAELGTLSFTHSDGTIEIYKADRIDLHYPAEHTITQDSRTPRYPLELSITHLLVKSSNFTTTNKHFAVKRAIVSLLFETNSLVSQEDAFLSRMGIDHRQLRPDGTFRTISKGETLDSSEKWQGNGPPGLDFAALQALKELLQFDHWVFRYYGSETQPPCSEDVVRLVFAVPRTVNVEQVMFLRAQIRKTRSSFSSFFEFLLSFCAFSRDFTGEGGEPVMEKFKYYGNNRKLQVFS